MLANREEQAEGQPAILFRKIWRPRRGEERHKTAPDVFLGGENLSEMFVRVHCLFMVDKRQRPRSPSREGKHRRSTLKCHRKMKGHNTRISCAGFSRVTDRYRLAFRLLRDGMTTHTHSATTASCFVQAGNAIAMWSILLQHDGTVHVPFGVNSSRRTQIIRNRMAFSY